VLIYGNLGFPALGAVGSGCGTTISRYAMLAILFALARPTLLPMLRPFRSDAFDLRALVRMTAIGLPIGLAFLLEVAIFSLVGLLMGRMGTIPLAGHQVAINLASLTFMVPMGVGVAAAALVGRAVGRRDAKGVRRAARLSLACGATFMVLSGLTLLAFPRPLAALYASDPAVIAVAAALIPLAGFFQVFDGLQVVASGILRGIGDTRAPMIVTMIGYWVIGLPVSLFLGHRLGLGPQGLWWGFVAGLATVALFLVLRVRSRVRNAIAPVLIDEDRGEELRLESAIGPDGDRTSQGIADTSTTARRTNTEPSASSR
jgi:MATE family multidrug resistance protein